MKNCFDLCTQPLEIKLYSTSCIKMHVLWYSVVNSLPIPTPTSVSQSLFGYKAAISRDILTGLALEMSAEQK